MHWLVVPPAPPYLPAGQFEHDVDPDVAYVPDAHVLHCPDCVMPVVAEYVPAAHAVHVLAPLAALAKDPARQLVHCVASEMPVWSW